MKPKTLSKKLKLSKTTVAHLGNSVMSGVKGGDPTNSVETDCATCNGTTCIVTLCNTCETCGCTYWKIYTCAFPECDI